MVGPLRHPDDPTARPYSAASLPGELAVRCRMPVGGTSVLSAGWFIFPTVQPLFGKHQHLEGEGRDTLIIPNPWLISSYGVTLISGGWCWCH